MTDKQFEDAFTAAGGWFILTQYETIAQWPGDLAQLIDHIYTLGFDKNRTGTNTRVSSVRRLMDNGRIEEALVKIRDSKRINAKHPEAYELACNLLKTYF